MPWPRTATERVLVEVFEGAAAQLLAVLEALGGGPCRPLHTGLPEEPEPQEVVLELLAAAASLLAGQTHTLLHTHTHSYTLTHTYTAVWSVSRALTVCVCGCVCVCV